MPLIIRVKCKSEARQEVNRCFRTSSPLGLMDAKSDFKLPLQRSHNFSTFSNFNKIKRKTIMYFNFIEPLNRGSTFFTHLYIILFFLFYYYIPFLF
ncbi:hypothetical protein CBB2_2427 [Clostridium botulinum]|nr:hypothetical protein CBB2_2427 [Clostridium botulinum]